jgi:hypothetical protein
MSQLRDMLQELGIAAAPQNHRHGRAGWVQICCPDCDQGLGKFHLGINENSLKANCWACGPKNLLGSLRTLSDLNYRELAAIIATIAPASVLSEQRVVPSRLKLPAGTGKLLRRHRDYLRERGFVPSEVRDLWRVQGIGVSDPTLSWRILIPIFRRGRMVSWTARSVGSDPRRYWSCSEEFEVVPHKQILYGMDFITSTAIIHEGPIDVWATGPGAVGTFGTSYTAAQLRLLSKLRKVIVCFDEGREAQARAQQLLQYLEPFPVECFNVIIDAKDPADALLHNPAELRRLRRFAFGKGGR